MEELSDNQSRQLRRTRCANEKRIGVKRIMVEPVELVDIDESRIMVNSGIWER